MIIEEQESMYSSRKFWLPVVGGLLVTAVGVLGAAMAFFAGGTHAGPDRATPAIGTLLFPFASLLMDVGLRSEVLGGFAFLLQFPIYGVLIGRADFNGTAKSYLLGVAVVHIAAMLLATFAG